MSHNCGHTGFCPICLSALLAELLASPDPHPVPCPCRICVKWAEIQELQKMVDLPSPH